MVQPTNIYFPKWAAILYGLLAIALVPWIFNLAETLPSRHVARHWDALWVGFDIIIYMALALTLFFAFKKSVWLAVAATALATLFIVDAWFDILTARPGNDQHVSLAFGVLEVVLAVLTYRLVYQIIHRSAKPRVNLRTEDGKH